MDHQRVIDWVDDHIVNSPGKIILLFLALTVVFAGGLGAIETESGQDQFIEDLPSFQALQDIQREFQPSFPDPSGSSTTTIIQSEQNVLSRQGLLHMLRVQQRVADQSAFRVTSTSSPARVVARTLDPNATTLDQQIRAVERATPGEIDAAVRTAAEREPGFSNQLSDDFNARSASATAARGTITHGIGTAEADPATASEPIPDKTGRIERIASTVDGEFLVLGNQPDTITDSLLLVVPAAFVLIVVFLTVAYRDLVDLLLGIGSIVVTIVWTFGFIGLAGIAFNPLLVAVPPLLLAVGIDFGIHAVNRYREERTRGKPISESMRLSTDQLLVAFFIVTGTTVIGFLSNLVSALAPIRDFGVVAAVGIVFTMLIFGVFLPAQKVYVDGLRERYPIPTLSESPLGSEGSIFGRSLTGGVFVARRTPAVFLLLVLLATAGAGWYATGVETGFEPEDFQPEEETPEFLQMLPEPFRPPAEYENVKNSNFQDEKFDEEGEIFMFVEGPMTRDDSLEALHRAGRDPPDTFVRDGRDAEAQSTVAVVRSRAAADPEFGRLVARNDRDDDGIPDDDLEEIYAALESSPASGELTSTLGEDRRSALVIYTVDGEAPNEEVTADARVVAERFRHDATPTGFAVIFEEASDLIFATVVDTLALSLVGASIFLVIAYGAIEGRPSLGVVNIVPIAITVAFVVASMRYFDVKFNAINGTILALTIGLGIDYSVHVVHRFVDEYDERELADALSRTIVGTGGALTGSMLTTVAGMGVLVLALNPAIGVFGLLTGLSVIYAYVSSLFVLPSVLVLWSRWEDGVLFPRVKALVLAAAES